MLVTMMMTSSTTTVTTTDTGETVTQTKLFSDKAQSLRQAEGLHPDMNPRSRNIASDSPTPIVLCLDVTGSMGDWPLIIWDKLPMLYGQIMMQEYIEDPHIAFCACGDIHGDKAPLQVSDFAAGTELDRWLNSIFIEGGGGGDRDSKAHHESYEMAAYFFAFHCKLPNRKKPLFFFMADETYYPKVTLGPVEHHIGDRWKGPKEIPSARVFKALRMNFNVFLLRKSYPGCDAEIRKNWEDVLGKGRILELANPKAIVDAMLGVISISSGARNLETYCKDMQERGQEQERINEVRDVLAQTNFELVNFEAEKPDLSSVYSKFERSGKC